MSELRFDPFAELSAYRDAMHQLIEEGWLGPRDLLPSALTSVLVPVDILDTGTAIVVPETVDAVHALTGIEKDGRKSIARTDQAMGMVREFLKG